MASEIRSVVFGWEDEEKDLPRLVPYPEQQSYGAPAYVTPTAPRTYTANTNSAVSMVHPMFNRRDSMAVPQKQHPLSEGIYFMMI